MSPTRARMASERARIARKPTFGPLPAWLCPTQPAIQGERREVLLFDAKAVDPEDREPVNDLSLKGKPLKRGRPGCIPAPGTQARAFYEVVPIAPAWITSAEAGAFIETDTKRAGTVLGTLADRGIIRRIGERGDTSWTRDG